MFSSEDDYDRIHAQIQGQQHIQYSIYIQYIYFSKNAHVHVRYLVCFYLKIGELGNVHRYGKYNNNNLKA